MFKLIVSYLYKQSFFLTLRNNWQKVNLKQMLSWVKLQLIELLPQKLFLINIRILLQFFMQIMQSERKPYLFKNKDYIKSGVYIKDPNLEYQSFILPLRHLEYNLQIVNNLNNIRTTQIYFNPTNKFLEVEYFLPINPEEISVYKFEAEFKNIKIEGIVKQKEKAHQQYSQAKKKGIQTVIGTFDSNFEHFLRIQIGNIPPNTQFTVSISMVQQIKIVMNTFYQLKIPSAIFPCFLSAQNEITWSFKIEIQTAKKLIFFKSPSHSISLFSQNEQKTQTLIAMQKPLKINKDFIFAYVTEDFQFPSFVVGNNLTTSTIMLSFIPKFCSLNIQDAYRASLINETFETDVSTVKSEYVFFLDCSGSMQGTRIQKAKESLILFLKSLPQDSQFNIIQFGSVSRRMFSSSKRNNSQTIQQMINQIRKIEANMGGTEIYEPLSTILGEKVILGYPREIFLLTDGFVSNIKKVILMVKKKTKHSRVHCIGVGNIVSSSLIEGCAKSGKGHHVFISDNQDPKEKIIQLLQTTLTPVISKISLKCDQDDIQSIVPNPDSTPYIVKDQVVNFYINLKKPLIESRVFNLEYQDSVTKLAHKVSIQVNPNSFINQPFVSKMGQFKVLKSLQNSVQLETSVEDEMYYSEKVKDPIKQIISFSIKHQIISKYTSFICVGKQLVDGQYQQFMSKGTQLYSVRQQQQEQLHSQQKTNNIFSDRIAKIQEFISRQSKKIQQALSQSLKNIAKGIHQEISRLRSFVRPPITVQIAMEGIYYILNTKHTSRGLNQPRSSKKALQIWFQVKNQYINAQLVKKITSFKGFSQIPTQNMAKLKQIIKLPEFQQQRAFKVSHFIGCICKWVRAVIYAYEIFIDIKQQKEQLHKIQEQMEIYMKKSCRQNPLAIVNYNSQPRGDLILSEQMKIVIMQESNGSWKSIDLLQKLGTNINQLYLLCQAVPSEIVITRLVILWLQKNFPSKIYRLIIKKANAWLSKAILQSKIQPSSLQTIQPR